MASPTPRIGSLAADGMKLLNFNVEAQCTPSRSALMTGRYAIRSGNSEVPLGTGIYGLTQWEITIGEMLSNMEYGHVQQMAYSGPAIFHTDCRSPPGDSMPPAANAFRH